MEQPTTRNASGRITNFSPKDVHARIWTFNSSAPNPHHASAVVRHDLHADFVAYAHASFDSPPNDTFDYALQHGFLRNFPHLTLDMWRKNKPNAVITAKSHLDLHRQNHRSTRQQQLPEESDSPSTAAADTPLDFADAAVIIVVPLKSHDTNYSDLMGRFPVESFLGNNYVLLSYFRGHVYAELMTDRTSASLVKAYSATFAYYARQNTNASTTKHPKV